MTTTAAAAAPAAALALEGVAHRYDAPGGGLLALGGVDLAVAPGEFVAIVGPSGCGKTTLLRVAAGLLEPAAGRARVLGGEPREARARRAYGLVAQEPGLLPWLDAEDNVALAFALAGRRPARGEARTLLERAGAGAFASYRPAALSGGMRQRVALARALAHRPRLLLMDEPFGALDELSRERLRAELPPLWERGGAAVLFVTHAVREAVLLADRVVALTPRPGRVAADIPIALPRPRGAALEETPAFRECVARVRAALREDRGGEDRGGGA